MKKSIQTKFILMLIIGIVLTEILTSTIGLYSFAQVLEDDSDRIVDLAARESAQELNALFGRIEQSVDVMAQHALEHLDNVDYLIEDPEYLDMYTKELEEMSVTVANKTNGAVGVYIRYNPETMPADSGFFHIRSTSEENFRSIEVTDFSKYSKNDAEHVGWYYEPIGNGKPTWMMPYYNKNIDVYMISYVVPLYKEGETIGIIGMDIDFAYIQSQVDAIEVYETGHAFLTDSAYEVMYSKYYEEGTRSLPDNLKVAYKPLENEMYLGVAVPQDEIMQEVDEMVAKLLWASILAIVVAVFVTVLLTKTIVKPLIHLNGAAKEIAAGNLDVEIECKTEDEVGMLAQSLRETVRELKTRIEYINNLAYVDELTGMKNNTAYWQEVSRVKESQMTEYAVLVIDLNGLKQINDMFGHHCGNELIITLSKIIADVFGYENAFRAGGDEFMVLLTGEKMKGVQKLEEAFEEKLRVQDGNIRAQAAIGSAVHQGDESYEEVFRRADEKMYANKEKMKQSGVNSSILM